MRFSQKMLEFFKSLKDLGVENFKCDEYEISFFSDSSSAQAEELQSESYKEEPSEEDVEVKLDGIKKAFGENTDWLFASADYRPDKALEEFIKNG